MSSLLAEGDTNLCPEFYMAASLQYEGIPMRFFNLLIVLFVVCGAVLPGMAQVNLPASPLAPPDVKAWSAKEEAASDQGGAETVRITVEIPPDHHGYLDKGDEGLLIPLTFSFASLEAHSVRVTQLSYPLGTRDEQAHATVLRGNGDFVFRLDNVSALPSDQAFATTLRSQICNDVTNICYPPRTTEIPLRFAAATTAPPAPSPTVPPVPVQEAPQTWRERITAWFQRSTDNLFLALALVFAAGLLATATPCVYPIIPITSAILIARGGQSRQQGRLHALVYFIGLIFFYTLLGAFAATTGTALSAIMTSAWVNLSFAVIFVYLGLSMLGLYEFQFLTTLTTKLDTASSRKSGFSGTFLMGTTAGLIVSPCVGPVVGAILLDLTGKAAAISVTSAGVPTDIVVRGVALMTAFGAGLGLPFLIVGLLSQRLPQSGTWLTKVKFLLGLPILYFAYTYYVKGMETLNVSANVAHAMLVGIVAIALAVFIGAFHTLGERPQRQMLLRRACGIILLIIGVHFLYNGLGRSGILIDLSIDTPRRVATAEQSANRSSVNNGQRPQVETHGNLQWLRDVEVARQRASSEGKPLFVDFYATWCANCKAFNRLALQHNELNAALQKAVLIKIYDTDPDFRTFQEDRRFPELRGVGGQPFLPLFAIYSPQGELVWKGQDYRAVGTMITHLQRARYAAAR